jgi:hypothetical protein
MPATSLETLGPPRAPGPLNNGRRAGGGGDGEERKDGEGARGGGGERAGRAAALLSVGEWIFPAPRELPTLSLAGKENLPAALRGDLTA